MRSPMILAVFAVFGIVGGASAGVLAVPGDVADTGFVHVAEGCGPGGWRSGLDGRCRPLGVYAHGVPGYACPAGWHVGPGGGACWPNR